MSSEALKACRVSSEMDKCESGQMLLLLICYTYQASSEIKPLSCAKRLTAFENPTVIDKTLLIV